MKEAANLVRVKIPADLGCTGAAYWKDAQIDASIAALVRALQEGEIDMRGSCSGHGRLPGDIHLQDGRVLVILGDDYFVHPVRTLLRAAWQHVRESLRRRLEIAWNRNRA